MSELVIHQCGRDKYGKYYLNATIPGEEIFLRGLTWPAFVEELAILFDEDKDLKKKGKGMV